MAGKLFSYRDCLDEAFAELDRQAASTFANAPASVRRHALTVR
jgi:hypothetical protein